MSPVEVDRKEKTLLVARSAARDLLRLVRALKSEGVMTTLGEGEREALDQCNQDLANALAAVERDVLGGATLFLAEVERSVAETRALLAATRDSILDGLGTQRAAVMRAMMRVEVTDDDLMVEAVAPTPSELAAARKRAERRLADMRRAESRRRRVEAQAIDSHMPLAGHIAELPAPWLRAVAIAVGCEGLRDPEAIAARLLDAGGPSGLAAIVAQLRPRERQALSALLEADGVMLARAFEVRFGDSVDDGYDWDVEPPTSVLGRLRVRGLCVVGRTALGPNPRSRPRAVVVPFDLRGPLARALAAVPTAPSFERTVPADVVEDTMADTDDPDAAESESIEFDRVQPELAAFAASAAESMASPAATGAVIYYVERIWAAYETAHPGRLSRVRRHDLASARRESDQQLAALAVMHEKLLPRRVATLMAGQPHLYAYLAAAIEDLDVDEADRALVFHACDTAIRAFDGAL